MVPYYYLAGAVGFTTGMANLTLAKSIELHEAAISNRWPLTMKLRDNFEPLTEARRKLSNAMLKGGLEMMGLAGGPLRSSGRRLTAAERRTVRRLLKQSNLL